MDQKYVNEFTKDWELLDSSGDLEFYSYFDKVDWSKKYAVKRNGEVLYDFEEDQHGNIYSFFEAVCKLLK